MLAAGGSDTRGNGVYLLLLLNVVVFLADHMLLFRPLKALYLNHAAPQLHQFITHMFCHVDASHLMNNLFLLLVFGKVRCGAEAARPHVAAGPGGGGGLGGGTAHACRAPPTQACSALVRVRL